MVGEDRGFAAGRAGCSGYRAVGAWPLEARRATSKIKLERMAYFQGREKWRFLHHVHHTFHHNFTTFYHRKTWWKSQNPLLKHPFHDTDFFLQRP
jgi:hypothetical protein